MTASPEHIDKPEPRGQAVLAFLAICAIYLALPRDLVVGPFWLLPTLIVILLVPTMVSHRVGRQSLNRTLGFVINGITTLALIGSVILLVRHRLASGAPAAVAAISRTPLAYERDRLCVLVLAGRRRWSDFAPERKEIWQYSFLFPKCRFRMTNAGNSIVFVGDRALSIICLSRSHKAPPLVQPTHLCWCVGLKSWRWSRF